MTLASIAAFSAAAGGVLSQHHGKRWHSDVNKILLDENAVAVTLAVSGGEVLGGR